MLFFGEQLRKPLGATGNSKGGALERKGTFSGATRDWLSISPDGSVLRRRTREPHL
jgi:hypothetical protein